VSTTTKFTPTRGVPVTLDRVRHLRFPIGVLRPEMFEGATLSRILWLGLRGDDPDLTEETVNDLIDLETLPSLRDALKKASSGMIDLKKLFPVMFGVEEKEDPQVPSPVAGDGGSE